MLQNYKYLFLLTLVISHWTFVEHSDETVNVSSFGAKGNGIHDDTMAIQRATNTGKIVLFGKGSFLVKQAIKYRGRVVWKGLGRSSIIISDYNVLSVENGSNSFITSLTFNNLTAPFIVSRGILGESKRVILHKSNSPGYQPTINDGDIWNQISDKNKQQDKGPSIVFYGNSTNITVDKLFGNFLSIMMNDTQKSCVQNCNFRGGKNVFGGIVFVNLQERGIGNRAINNHVSYASFSGIVFIANQEGIISGNECDHNGESGVKLYQNKIGNVNARCYKMDIKSNKSTYNEYDGFDLQSDNPRHGNTLSNHSISKNISENNSGTGYIVDGIGIIFQGNLAKNNLRDGLNAFANDSEFTGNVFSNNNNGGIATGVHQFTLTNGERNIIKNNTFENRKRIGYNIYDNTGRNTIVGNIQLNGINGIFSGKKFLLN